MLTSGTDYTFDESGYELEPRHVLAQRSQEVDGRRGPAGILITALRPFLAQFRACS